MVIPKTVDKETRQVYVQEQHRLFNCHPSKAYYHLPENVRLALDPLRVNTKCELHKSLEKIATAAIHYQDAINGHQNENALIEYWTGIRELYLFTAAIASDVSALDNDRDEFLIAASECTARIQKHEQHREKNHPLDLD